MWRLNEMALLPEITRFSSVSGGSILAGLLAVRWDRLKFHDGVALNFGDEIVNPVWKFCGKNIDWAAVALGIIAGTRKLEHSYRRHLVGNAALRDLPDEPAFISTRLTLKRPQLHPVENWTAHLAPGRCRVSRPFVGQGNRRVIGLPTRLPRREVRPGP